MFKRVIIPFFLSFGAILSMLFLYVLLPQYLVSRFTPHNKTFLALNLPASLPKPTPTPLPTPTPTPSPDLTPATISIPKLNIQTAIEQVGLTKTNRMEVPKNAANVAWYMYGPKPSEPGNAVMAGHYDTVTGKPAIFYNLEDLESGDEIEVVSKENVRSIFVVVDKAIIPYKEFPNEKVFKTRPGTNLNLITCGGVWNARERSYSDRIVVYTELKSYSVTL